MGRVCGVVLGAAIAMLPAFAGAAPPSDAVAPGVADWIGAAALAMAPLATTEPRYLVQFPPTRQPPGAPPHPWAHYAVTPEQTATARQTVSTPQQYPLLIDAERDGKVEYAPLSPAGATFDWNADGIAENTAWVVGSRDALLAVDVDGNGRIDNGREVVSYIPIAPAQARARRFGLPDPVGGVWLLGEDKDGNGVIDARDPIWPRLQLWFASQRVEWDRTGERLVPVACSGIASISLWGPGTVDDRLSADKDAVPRRRLSVKWYADADRPVPQSEGPVGVPDCPARTPAAGLQEGLAEVVSLPVRLHYGLELPRGAPPPIPPEIAALPDLPNLGVVHSLHRAMLTDAALRPLLDDYLRQPDALGSAAGDALDKLLYRLAGVDGVALDAHGDFLDGRQLEAEERYHGDPYWNPFFGRYPPPKASQWETLDYYRVRSFMSLCLVLQSPRGEALHGLYCDVGDMRIDGRLDWDWLVAHSPGERPAARDRWRDTAVLLQLQALASYKEFEPGPYVDALERARSAGSPVPTLEELQGR